ncbi:MAG TPA: carboxypeptidase-like regulatory domain-containing protein [Chitinophagaceae bacterium]|nr:carboxypeptidase-like regulatory domain-containing protein [Chitinophagaceae bacterium]
MRLLIALGCLLLSIAMKAQVTISGKVRDNKGKPVAGASISLKNTYDGGTSDSTGNYKFRTSEKGQQTLLTTSIGYKLAEQSINLDKSSVQVEISLREEPSELKAVVVTAGTFEASDTKRATVLSPIDIVTTASANADVTNAIKTLPGPQQVGEQEGLFVRGGTAQETKVFIDGTQVNNFYFSSVPDIAQRGRFSPFIFKGTVFSSGGYSALYGQALSSALILESVDLPERSSASLGISSVGLSGGWQELNKKKTASWGVAYSYTNLLPYFELVKQKPDYVTLPEFHNAEANFRIKTSKTGMIKFYGYFNLNRLGFRTPNIDSSILKDAFDLQNFNVYTNISWREKLGKKWKLYLGSSYSTNTDKYNQELQDQENVPQSFNHEPFASKIFDLKSNAELAQVKSVLERRLSGISSFRFGAEYLFSRDKTDFTNPYVSNATNQFDDHFTAAFAETDIYLTNDLAAKIGGRYEHSSYLGKSNLVPRVSLAYKVGQQGQVSMAYGIFYQKPDRQILLFQDKLGYQKATHYILNYQKISRDYTLRTEVYYKKYHNLIKTVPDTSNKGFGDAKGFEIFWRDRKTFKNVDYWISYSFLDTKRDHLNFPYALQPNFATHHTASLVVKKFVSKLKSMVNGSYTFATGRPYYNIRYDQGDDKYKIYDQGTTVPYHSLSFSVNYLPNIFKQGANKFTVFVFSVTNVLGSNQVYGYNYSYSGTSKQPITPPAKRFYFIGCFLSFGVDRTEDVINSNL